MNYGNYGSSYAGRAVSAPEPTNLERAQSNIKTAASALTPKDRGVSPNYEKASAHALVAIACLLAEIAEQPPWRPVTDQLGRIVEPT